MTPGSWVKARITQWGNSTATKLAKIPTPRANFTPMDTTFRMLAVSRLPQYWAAKIKMAPSMPPTNICTTRLKLAAHTHRKWRLSPSEPIIKLSAKFTPKVMRFCREMGTAKVTSDR